ncbi:MAG: DNA-binding protein [Bdellovibrio sp.]|nr:MAG: DNA-binding protein [Bdellovibrio sp.]
MKIGVLGSGEVGKILANGFLKHGYTVQRGSRDPQKLKDWLATAGTKASIGSFEEAAKFGEMLVLAVKGTAAESVIRSLGTTLNGKVVIDVTNPIADKPPVNGVLQFFTTLDHSLMEKMQNTAPQAHFVKAFSSVGGALMVNPEFGAVRPTMFICGNDNGAKSKVKEILGKFGWDSEDMGAVEAARAIEPLCMLWCIPGLRSNQWMHAFKLLKK